MFKKLSVLILVIFLICFTIGCGDKSIKNQEKVNSDNNETKQEVSKDMKKGAIKIGYIGALSGNSADMGEPARKGILMAVDEVNEEGGIEGKQIELIAMDDEANPAKSATQATKLIQQDKIIAAIGGPNSGTVLANREIFKEANIPEVISIGTVDSIIDPEHPTFKTTFRTGSSDSYMIKLMASYVKSKGYKKIGVIADTSAYGQASVEKLKEVFEEKGIPITKVVTHEVAATDLTSQALKLKNNEVDVVYSYNLGPDAAMFMKTIKQMGWEVPVLGGRGLNMKAFIDLVRDAGEGIIIPCDVDMDKEEIKEFKKKFDEKFDVVPNYMFPAMGYDAARVVIEGLKRSKGNGGDELINALESIKDFPVTIGQPGAKLSFGPDKHEGATKGWDVLLTIKNGEFVLFNEFPPEE